MATYSEVLFHVGEGIVSPVADGRDMVSNLVHLPEGFGLCSHLELTCVMSEWIASGSTVVMQQEPITLTTFEGGLAHTWSHHFDNFVYKANCGTISIT